MVNEIWKDIDGFEGFYQVSNLGRVKSLERVRLGKNGCFIKVKEKILTQCKDKEYLRIRLCKDCKGKMFQVQRLVADAFIPNPENKPEVNHKDENKENNCVWNLEWCDRKYNINYGTHNKRSAEKRSKKVLCIETGIIFQSTREVERQTGITSQSISSCCKGKLKTAGKFHWKYI